MSKKRREQRSFEAAWRNGPSFRFGNDPSDRYKTIMDFEVALVPDAYHGLGMEWRSTSLGLLTPLICFLHLEDPAWRHDEGDAALVDGWQPIGTPESAFIEMDQGFVVTIWADRRFVHVEYGHDEDEHGFLISTWYRVPHEIFDAAWDDMLRRLKAVHEGS